MALLYAGSIVCWAAAARYFGAWVGHRRRRSAPRLPGLRPHVPRALERARVRGRLRRLGAARDAGGRSRRRSDASRSSASGSPCSRSSVRGTPCCSRSPSFPLARSPALARPARADRRVRARGRCCRSLAWSVHNGVRFDCWGLARGGNAIVPFYRAFITDHIVSPENGEQSRRLAAAMQRAPAHARAVPLVRRHPRPALRAGELPRPRGPLPALRPGLRMGLRLRRPPRAPVSRACARTRASTRAVSRGRSGTSSRRRSSASCPRTREAGRAPPAAGDRRRSTGSAFRRRREGEPIPAGQVVWISRPDQSIRQVWTSPTEWHFEFDRACRASPLRARSSARTQRPLRRAPRPRRATRGSHSASTSSRAGSRGRGCGSSSA